MADVSWETTDPDKLSKFVKTPTKKKSLDDLGSSVLARLRAKRRKYNSEKELLTKLQAMEKVRVCSSNILGTHFVRHTGCNDESRP